MTLFRVDLDIYDSSTRASFLFGVLLVGNILDNIPNPKTLALTLQILVAFAWILTGIHVTYALKKNCDSALFIGSIEMISEIFASGVVLINIVQVYNWFSKRYI